MIYVSCLMLYVICYIYIYTWYMVCLIVCVPCCIFHGICYMLSCICNTWNAICTMYPCGNTRLAQDVAYVKSQHRLARVCQKQTNAWPFKTLQFGVLGLGSSTMEPISDGVDRNAQSTWINVNENPLVKHHFPITNRFLVTSPWYFHWSTWYLHDIPIISPLIHPTL